METRITNCEVDLKEAQNEIKKLNESLNTSNLEKKGLSGEIALLGEKIENLDKQLTKLQKSIDDERTSQKQDNNTIIQDIKSLHQCMISEKISNARNSVVISIIIPIIILAVGLGMGIK